MKYKIILMMIASFLIAGCGDVPIFTEMKTNRLKVVVKGTLEMDGVSNFASMPSANSASMQDDSVDDVTAGTNDVLPTSFMFDIAELRLDGKKFSNYRRIIEASLAGDKTTEPEPFFNGEGVILKNDDPGNGHYNYVEVFIRKMAFDNAMVYQSTGSTLTYEKPAEIIFHEVTRQGFDFNQLQVNSYWDSLRLESGEILRNFPIEVPIIGGLDYSRDNIETVLEIRFVIKNFVKKYEYDYYDTGVFKVTHYYAPSDWLRDVRAGESTIGRNLHAVARAYIPGKTGTITGNGAGANRYVIAIPAGDPITDYTIPNKGSTLRTTKVPNCDLPKPPSDPGAYIEARLDYYLKYENYKYFWNTEATACVNLTKYEAEWDAYEAAVENFKIAPYVVVSNGSGSYTFNNVAPGSYDVYVANVPLYGELFVDGDFGSKLGTVLNLLVGETRAPL